MGTGAAADRALFDPRLTVGAEWRGRAGDVDCGVSFGLVGSGIRRGPGGAYEESPVTRFAFPSAMSP